MHITIPLLVLLTTGAIALPNHLESKRQWTYDIPFSYDGPLGPAEKCPATYEGWYVTEDKGTLVGAPPNYPNYDCITWGTSANWIGINLVLSNSTGLIAYSDAHCQNIVSWIQCPLNTKGVDCNDGQFCVEQSKNGGAGSWQSVIYRVP